MLKLAIKSRLPLISVYTDDPVNVGAVLTMIAGKKAQPHSPALKAPIGKTQLYYCLHTDKLDYALLFKQFSSKAAVLCVVNPPSAHPATFDAGVVTPPLKMIENFVNNHAESTKQATALVAALAGLSFKEVTEVSAMAQAKHGKYTAKAVRDVRRTFFGSVRGLQMLSTSFLYYRADKTLVDWLEASGRFLTEFDEPLLTPRGLLFNGPPGTGKTMGAKYIAHELNLPIYLLDVAGLMSKYVGESEQNLQLALKQAEQSAPCVLLIDEVEKLFNTSTEDSGVSSRLLSSILWWLQEHQSKVLTIMTTNKHTVIPPELYRERRIDSELTFKLLDDKGIHWFVMGLHEEMQKRTGLDPAITLDDFPSPCSHAKATQVVMEKFKEEYLKTKG